jgi:hypothetical protein
MIDGKHQRRWMPSIRHQIMVRVAAIAAIKTILIVFIIGRDRGESATKGQAGKADKRKRQQSAEDTIGEAYHQPSAKTRDGIGHNNQSINQSNSAQQR